MGMMWGVHEPQLIKKLGMIGLICDDGTVDMDAVERAVMHGFKASKDKFPISILGHTFTFKPEDWTTFKRMF